MSRLQRLQRRNLVLFVLAILLTGGVLLRPSRSATLDKEGWTRQFPDFETEMARRIEITRSGAGGADAVTLVQEASGAWVVESEHGYPAKPTTVTTLLEGIADMRRRKLVTTRQETFESYAGPDGFTEVRVYGPGGKALVAFGLGRSADKYPEVHTRVGEGDDAEIAQTIHVTPSMVETRLTSWVEPRIWSGLRSELMIRLDVEREGETLVFARRGESPADVEADVPEVGEEGEPAWWILEPPPPGPPRDDGVVENLGRFFTGLRLQAVRGRADDDEARAALGLEPPVATITYWQKQGETVERATLTVGPKTDDDRHPVKKGDSPWVYTVPAYALRDFLDPVASFRPEPEEPEEPEEPDDPGEDPGDDPGDDPGKEPGEEKPPAEEPGGDGR